MDLVSNSPFSIATVTWQPQAGAWNLTVCVKATFTLVHGGEATLAARQDPPEDDAYFDGDARGTLYAPSDFAPYKPRADVIFVGSAHAPPGKEVRDLIARLSVGDFTKAVRVVGDRSWVRTGGGGLAASTTASFAMLPLRYERAATRGDNLGGLTSVAKHAEPGQRLPNVELAEDREGATPGFGPMPPAWRARRGHLGEAAILWAFRVSPKPGRPGAPALQERPAPPPQGFDFGFFNAAPRDQQLDLLRQASTIVLENLHPEVARFETRLPNLKPRVFREATGTKRATEVAMRCDTLWIDGTRSVAVVSWRGITPVPGPDASKFGRFMVVAETPAERIRLDDIVSKFGGSTEEGADDLSVRHDAVKRIAPPSTPGGLGTLGGVALGAPPPNVPLSPRPKTPTLQMPSSPSEPSPARGKTEPFPQAAKPRRAEPSVRDPEAEDDANTPTPADLNTSTDILASKLEAAVLPFKPVVGAPVARASETPATKLSGLPFRPKEPENPDAARPPANARLAALPFKPPSEPGFIDDDRTRPVALPAHAGSLPFAPRPAARVFADDPSTSRDDHPPMEDPTTSAKGLPRMPEMVVKPQGGMRLGGGSGPPPTQLGRSALGEAESIDEETEFDDRPPFDLATAASDEQPDMFRHVPEPPMLGRLKTEPPPAQVDVKKPDFLGALYERAPAASASAAPTPAPSPSSPTNAAPPAPPSSPEAAPKTDPATFPIEKCAAINAEIAMKRAPMAEVLKKHQVEGDEWTVVDRHWLASITKETERGKTTLLGTYDTAYVGALERIRGPITTEEYAKVVVGVERGDVAAVLATLGLPRTALMRIERVWTKRLAEDGKLAQQVGAAVDTARKS